MKRAALYFFYDSDGIVDRYNLYMLEALRPHVDALYIVVNGLLSADGRRAFERLADDVYVRENKGFDVWAYKDGMAHIGWDTVTAFDEFILMNHTNYGPVYPLDEMLDAMAGRDVDFWGITKHHGHPFDPYNACEYGYIPAHIQSSFIAVRASLMRTNDFRAYWEKMPMIDSYEGSICLHEAVFTEKFTRLGYTSDVYVNTDDLKDVADYPLMLMPVELIKNRRCPIFKRKSFFNIYEELMDVTCGQPTMELYDYLRHETDYDMDMIWDNLLRTANMWDIKQRMQLTHVLPTDVEKESPAPPKVALFLHVYYLDMLDTCRAYADNMPPYADIYITTDTEDKRRSIQSAMDNLGGRRVEVVVVANRGREYTGFLIGLKDRYAQYDLICIAHGKKSRYEKPHIIGDSFAYHCFENVLASPAYTANVIATFQNNPRLGLMVPPPPEHAMYYTTVGREWRGDYTGTVEAMARLGVQAPIDPSKPPVAPLGGFFWFRTQALSKLYEYDFTYDMFPEEPCTAPDGTIMHIIERIYPFVAQDAGYYSAWLMSDRYAVQRMTNQYKTIRDFNEPLFWVFGEGDRHMTLNHLNTTLGVLQSTRSQEGLSTRMLARTLLKRIAGPRACRLYRRFADAIKRRRRGALTGKGEPI